MDSHLLWHLVLSNTFWFLTIGWVTVVLIFISLISNGVEYLLRHLLATLLWKNVYVSCRHLIPSCILNLPIKITFFHPEVPPSEFSLERYCWWQTPSTLFLEMSLSLPSFMKDSFILNRILDWQLLSFSSLKISLHCLQTSIIAVEKLAVSVIVAPSRAIVFSWVLFVCR